MKVALDALKNNLELFAQKHSNEIKKDPVFRTQFQTMCAQVGVDPLASNKSFWTEMLGFGDFYYQLSVQIAQVCIVTREQNGGLIEIGELIKQVEKMRGKHSQAISRDDVLQSLKCLKPLGDGFSVIKMGQRTLIRSVPEEKRGYADVDMLINDLKWTEDRAQSNLTTLMNEGICWIDEQSTPHSYWISGLYF
ncbi:ESCRT-II subunit protein snf8 [Boothiomyces macroporosus]|uniref:ESCRT-II subunit protein snf8 n=1 Tax=Boothiomyces macroporosus TaxID=261099 RepID=A0AAD5UN38_9FUNG|nr:ESCRT-II subunit protein snf8 [Boothiomyces macroporosus]